MRKNIICLLIVGCLFSGTAAKAAEERLEALRPELAKIQSLMEECEQAGLDIGYEQVDYGVIRDFIEYGKQDIEWGDTDRAEYVADTLEKMSSELKEKLASYRRGMTSPHTVMRNFPENYGGTENGNFVSKDGTPIIYNGFGVFDQLKNDIPKMQEFGADLVQIEIGPNNVLVKKGAINGWNSTVYGNAQASSAVTENAGRSGKYGLKIVNGTTAANAYLAINQTVSVKPNTTYTLTFYAKTESGGAFSYSMQGWTAPRNHISTGTHDWTQYSASYTTGESEYSMEILFISSAKSGAIYLDDISMTEDGENIIQNGGFEDSQSEVSEHFQANTAPIRDKVVRMLDRAEKNDVMVNVLISPHYFPSWILKEYPYTKEINCGLGYDINDPIIQEALDLYIKTLMGEISSHPALHSICLTNEPKCITRGQDTLLPEYAQYLKTAHGNDISKLNKRYGTNYQSFSDVPMPSGDTMDAAYYDWVQFNNKYTSAWHKWIADTVKKYAPDMPVHSKIMTIFGNSDSLNYGIDPEDFAEFTDYSGHDAWGFLGSTASGLVSKLAWYDLLRSIKPDAPVINSEDHIIEDRNTNYSEKQAVHVGADLWQGAVHGRDASIIWIWGRTQNKTANTYGNILYRPDVLSAAGKRSLDLNRLSEQVAVLQNAEHKATILYSPTSRAYSQNAVRCLLHAYEAALYAGANPKFITERQLAEGISPEGVLILPETRNIPDAAYTALADYKSRGGKVIALGSDCLASDEYNNQRGGGVNFDWTFSVERSGKNIMKPTLAEVQQKITELAGLSEPLTDLDGEIVTGVERVMSGSLWNLCNYTWNTTKRISFDGSAIDLLTGKIYEGEVDLEPFVPVLLDFDGLKEAEITIEARRQGDGTLLITAENHGDAADVLEVNIRVRNGTETVKGAHFSKYLPGHGKAKLTYSFSGLENSVTIEGRYDNGRKQTASIENL